MMKHTLHTLLLAILAVSTLGAAPATEPKVATEKPSVSTASAKKERRPFFRRRRPAAAPDVLVKREEPATRGSERERERKQRDVTGEDEDDKDKKVKKKDGPSPQGRPVELHMKRGSSRKFDLRSLPQTAPRKRERPEREGPEPHPVLIETTPDAHPVGTEVAVPTLNAPAPAPTMNFAGLDFANFGDGHPPDTVGDVGPAYYIQAINTSLGIYRKSDGVRVAAFSFDTFMSQGNFGNLCDTDNFGDPVILYDTFEDRWIVTDFAFQLDGSDNVVNPPGAFQCFAVSLTGDPVSGGWSYYSLNTEGGLGDYEKFGIWPDGLYMSANMFDYAASGSFQNPRVYAFNKAQMYAGSPTVQVVRFEAPAADFTLLPSNARLQAGTPPVGAPNYFVSTWQFLNGLSVYKFHVDWNSVSLSTFTGPDVPIAGTSWPDAAVANAPSLGGATLDTLGLRAMMQNQYSNVGGVESLWATHTVRRANTTGFAAPRWYQVNVTGGTVNLTLPQAATWDPDGANVMHRFMPSLAVDRAGNLALGYSTSSSTTRPAIKYAGRLAGDPINTFGKTEQVLIQGLGTQTGTSRWGDYSAMSLDPDGCTFWYTNMYYAANGLDYQTRIGSFAYPECTPVGAGGTISGTVTATAGGAPIGGATIQLGARSTTTNGSGVYSFTSIPAGTYQTIVASAPGYTTASSSNVVVTDGGTTPRNFSLALAPASACPVDTTQANFQTGVGTNVDLLTTPGSVILLNAASVDRHADDNGFGSGYGFNNTSLIGQTFTPSVTGQLTAVDASIFCAACAGANPNLILEVRTTASGQPVMTAGGLLATATIAGTSSASGGFFTFPYGTPPTLTSGTQYGIVIRTATLRATGTQAWLASSGDVMSGGRRVSCTTTTCTNPSGSNNNSDLIFKAYMKIGFPASGDFVSSVKDANPAPGITPTWTTLSWTGVTPANTTLRFQVAASDSPAGPFNFVGPNGTAGTFFTTSGASLTQFYNKRYLQYKAYLATTNSAVTPTLNDVTICYADIDCSGTTAPIAPTPAQVCSGSSGNTASGPAGATSYAWSITNGTIQGSTTSQSVTYTAGTSGTVGLMLSIVAANTCQVTSSVDVTINPIPATPTVTPGGPTTFCSGGSVTLTSSSATGNQWYDGVTLLAGQTNQSYIATTSGNYNVVVTTAGCSSAPSTSTSVTVNPAPPTPTVTPGGPTTFCTGGSVTLTSSSASGNQWYDGVTLLAGQTGQNYIATASGNYNVVVTSAGCSSAPSASTAVTVNPTPATPTVTSGGPTTFCSGGSVTLTSSSATGNQWYDGVTLLAGETNQNYVASTSGNYNVVVTTNGCSSAPSASTAVTVNPTPPTPTITPDGPTTFCTEGSVTLTSSSATGNQWYMAGNPIAGETGPTLLVTSAMVLSNNNFFAHFTVTVTSNGCSATSAATLVETLGTATPVIVANGPTTFCAGGSVELTVNGFGGTTGQWYLNGSPIAGETDEAYVATESGSYTFVDTFYANCPSDPSNAIVVTVNPIPPTPTITPDGPTTFCAGGSVTLTSSSASGNQWYDGVTLLAGQTGQNYIATTSGNYNVVVTTAGCSSAPSASTAVTVNPTPATPTVTPGGPTTFCSGGSVTLTSSSASGNQWYDGVTLLAGETNQTYIASTSGNYNVVVTTNGCPSAPSTSTAVTVNPIPPTPTITPDGPTTFCTDGSVTLTSSSATGNQWYMAGNPIVGETGPTLLVTSAMVLSNNNFFAHFTVTVTSNGCSSATSAATLVETLGTATPVIVANGPTTFCAGGSVELTVNGFGGTTGQWYLNGSPIAGQTDEAYVATESGSYTFVDTFYSNCPSDPSNAIVVTVNPIPPTPTITPDGPTTFCTDGSVTLTSSSATGNQWYMAGTPIAGETGPTLLVTSAMVLSNNNFFAHFTVTVTSNGCSSATAAATLVETLGTATPVIVANGPTTFCAGGSVELTVNGFGGTTGQWYLNGSPIAGQTDEAYVATASGSYTFVDTFYANCPSDPSNAIVVTVHATPPTPTITPDGPTTFCTDGSVTLTSSSATGNQWYMAGTPIAGETGPTLLVTSAMVLSNNNFFAHFTVTVTSNGCSSATSAATLVETLGTATPVIVANGPTTFCAGGSVELTVNGFGVPSGQWYLNGSPIAGQTGEAYVATASGSYTFVDTFYSNCPSDPSNAIVVTVNPIPPTPTITPDGPTTFCAGGSVTLTSSSAAGNQWYLNGNPIGGATNQTYLATATGNYTVTVTASGCSSTSAATSVTANPIPPTPTISGSTSICEGGSTTLTSTSATGNQWYRNNVLLPGETGQTYIATIAGAYSVVVTSNGCSSAHSPSRTVTVHPKPDATITVASPMFAGAGSTASVNVSCADATFNWLITGGTITAGAGTPRITFTAGAAGTLTLQVTVTTSAGCSDTKTANVTVQQASFGPPPFLRATAAGTASADLTWASVQLADHYEVHRSTDNVNWTLRGTSAGTTFSEGGLTPSTTHFYKVRTIKADTIASAFSAIDPATTFVFTDNPVTGCTTPVKTLHITQLRTAVNLARAAVGLAAFTFTDPTLTTATKIKTLHLTELRTALAPVLSAIAVTPVYTDPTLTGGVTKMKGAHINDLRDQIR